MHSLSKLALAVLPAFVAAAPANYQTLAPNVQYTDTFTALAPNVEYTNTFSADAPIVEYTNTFTAVYPTVEYTNTFTAVYPTVEYTNTFTAIPYPTSTESPEEPCTTSDVYPVSTDIPFEYNPSSYPVSDDIPAAPYPTAYEELTTTIHQTIVETVEVTLYPSAADIYPTDAGVPIDNGVCTKRQPTTTTTTVRVTVTVYPGASSVEGVAEPSTPCTTSTELPFSIYSSDIPIEPYPISTEVPIEAYPTSVEVPAEPYPVTTAAPVEQYTPVPTPEEAAVPVTPVTPVKPVAGGAGKRGLAYNDAGLTKPFIGNSKFSWGYNWDSAPGGLDSSFEFVPLLWGTGSEFTGKWFKNVKEAFAKGCGHVLSYNEPDHTEQAHISPAVAVAGWKTFMEPLKATHPGIKLGAPAVTNGGGDMGLGWLSPFLKLCVGCTIDFVPIHWYDSAQNVAYFKKHVQDAHNLSGKPIWITEFGASGSDAQVASFLDQVLPWLDSQPYVERYAYFMVSQGKLVNGGGLSSYGKAYAS